MELPLSEITSKNSNIIMTKDFNIFMSQLQETNQTLDFFCDFDKISQNVEDIKLSLCMLNSLVGATDMRNEIRVHSTLWTFLLLSVAKAKRKC